MRKHTQYIRVSSHGGQVLVCVWKDSLKNKINSDDYYATVSDDLEDITFENDEDLQPETIAWLRPLIRDVIKGAGSA